MREELNKVIESKEVLKMAGNLLMSISQDERERAVFRSRRMYQTDYESNIATAEDRGVRKVALNLLKRNRPIDEIMEDTGLTYDQVTALRNAD